MIPERIPMPGRQQEAANPASEVKNEHQRRPVSNDPAHIAELERENIRLQLLVAELLIKNQQLRKAD